MKNNNHELSLSNSICLFFFGGGGGGGGGGGEISPLSLLKLPRSEKFGCLQFCFVFFSMYVNVLRIKLGSQNMY